MSSDEPKSPSAFWKDHYTRHHLDAELPEAQKSDYSNDALRLQTYGWLVETLGSVAGLSCLDAGCGGGELARMLDALGGRVDAFDLVEPTLARLAREHPRVRWFVADLTDLDASAIGAGYDRILMSEVLQYVDAPAAIRSLWKRLRPGGRLSAVVPNAACPIVRRAQARFPGRYFGVAAPELAAAAATLEGLARFRWRGATFLTDQSVVPYGLGAWSESGREPEGTPPNRIHFVLTRAA